MSKLRLWTDKLLLHSSNWLKNTSQSHVLSEKPDFSREPRPSKSRWRHNWWLIYDNIGPVVLLILPIRSQTCCQSELTESQLKSRRNKLSWSSLLMMSIQSKLFSSFPLSVAVWVSNRILIRMPHNGMTHRCSILHCQGQISTWSISRPQELFLCRSDPGQLWRSIRPRQDCRIR